ncbi:MAG: hypothetical protein ABFS34_00930 [Gemmatimonadota bacterium]
MRIAIDPVPLVLGIYAHVGKLLDQAEERHEDDNAESLGKRYGRGTQQSADKDVQRLVRALHSDVKTADKLLKKTADAWKISQETDLVNLVVQKRGEEPQPRSYVLLKLADVRALLTSIAAAAKGAGEEQSVGEELAAAASGLSGRPGDYVTFGFDPWE